MPSRAKTAPWHERRDVMHERAKRYAQVAEAAREVLTTAVTFRRGASLYALPLAALREVRPLQRFCPIPGARPILPGVVHYRGELLSVLDLSMLISTERPKDEPSWVLVTEHAGERVGIAADDVMDVLDVESGDLSPVPLTLGDVADTFLGLTYWGALLLDTARLLDAPTLTSAF